MWIVLGILAFLAILITVILVLPVDILIKNDEKNELILRYRYCFKTFGEDPDPNDPIVKMLKTASGLDRLKTQRIKTDLRQEGVGKTVTDSYDVITGLIKELLGLLRYGTVIKLHIHILCAGDGADEVAVSYGQCSTATYSLLHVLRSFLKVRKRGCKINVGCDFVGEESQFRYDAILRIRAFRVLAAFWRTAMAEAKRNAAQNQQK